MDFDDSIVFLGCTLAEILALNKETATALLEQLAATPDKFNVKPGNQAACVKALGHVKAKQWQVTPYLAKGKEQDPAPENYVLSGIEFPAFDTVDSAAYALSLVDLPTNATRKDFVLRGICVTKLFQVWAGRKTMTLLSFVRNEGLPAGVTPTPSADYQIGSTITALVPAQPKGIEATPQVTTRTKIQRARYNWLEPNIKNDVCQRPNGETIWEQQDAFKDPNRSIVNKDGGAGQLFGHCAETFAVPVAMLATELKRRTDYTGFCTYAKVFKSISTVEQLEAQFDKLFDDPCLNCATGIIGNLGGELANFKLKANPKAYVSGSGGVAASVAVKNVPVAALVGTNAMDAEPLAASVVGAAA